MKFAWLRILLCVGLSVVSSVALSVEVTVPLVFQPQESVAANNLSSLPPSILDKPVALALIDARGDTSNRIGQGTNDDDSTFAYVSAQPVADFTEAVARQLFTGNGIRLDRASPLQLKLRLTGFSIDESNKAVGSMYGGVVKFAFTLEQDGKRLSEGAAEGSARRYGQSASIGNVAQVLSDATKQALADVLADSQLQAAWKSGVASADSQPGDPVAAKLERLDALLKAGNISPEEHKRARAEVLKGI